MTSGLRAEIQHRLDVIGEVFFLARFADFPCRDMGEQIPLRSYERDVCETLGAAEGAEHVDVLQGWAAHFAVRDVAEVEDSCDFDIFPVPVLVSNFEMELIQSLSYVNSIQVMIFFRTSVSD